MKRALLPLLLLPLLACEEEQIAAANPEIHLCPAGEVTLDDCDRSFDLGELAITVTHSVRLVVRNAGRAPLGVREVRAGVEWVVPVTEPQVINNGAALEVVLEVTPPELGALEATVFVESDDPERPTAAVNLLLDGVPKPVPELELCLGERCESRVERFEVDFGVVRRAQSEVREVIVRNVGELELAIEEVALVDESSEAGELSVESSTRPGVLAPGDAAPLLFAYAPTDAVADRLTATITSTDPEAPAVDIVVLGTSDPNDPPVASAAEFETGLTNLQVTVNELVALDGAASADPEGDPLVYEWSLIAPAGSDAALDDPAAGRVLFTPDVAGAYEAELVVYDSLGQASLSASTVLIEAVPEAALRVEIRWAQGGDVDVHLVPSGDALFSDTDCHFGAPRPDLGVQGDPIDDPELTADSELSPGAESIVFVQPPDGTYGVYVQYFDAANRGAATVNVDVIAFDQSPTLFTGSQTLPDTCALWRVGDVTFPAGTFVAAPPGTSTLCP